MSEPMISASTVTAAILGIAFGLLVGGILQKRYTEKHTLWLNDVYIECNPGRSPIRHFIFQNNWFTEEAPK